LAESKANGVPTKNLWKSTRFDPAKFRDLREFVREAFGNLDESSEISGLLHDAIDSRPPLESLAIREMS